MRSGAAILVDTCAGVRPGERVVIVTDEMAEMPGAHVTIHDVATVPLGEGWALDGGWFQIDASEGGDPIAVGSFLLLCKQGEDGSWKMHWEVSNIQPLTG